MTSVLQLQFHNKLLRLAEIVWWQPFALFCLLTILMMSLFGLLAIWAGLGRGHWLRAAVVLGCISLLLVIPAFELVTVYVIQAGLTVVALGAWRNWRLARRGGRCGAAVPAALCRREPAPQVAETGQRSPWQFSILDLLLLTALGRGYRHADQRAERPGQVGPVLAEGVIMAALSVGMAWIALRTAAAGCGCPVLHSVSRQGADGGVARIVAVGTPASTAACAGIRGQSGLSRAGLVLVSLAILARPPQSFGGWPTLARPQN